MGMKRTYYGMIIVVLFMILCSACAPQPKEVIEMPFSLVADGETYVGDYTGTTFDKLPNGEGQFHFSDSTIEFTCSGTWENGALVGTNRLKYNGMVLVYNDISFVGLYDGEAILLKPSGKGNYTAEHRENYIEYSGGWKDGVFAGEGELKTDVYEVLFDNGSNFGSYNGTVVDSLAEGEGVFQGENSEGVPYTYTGTFVGGKFHGDGIRKYHNEDYYIQAGNFSEGDFTPTPLEFFTALGTRESDAYEISANAKNFIEKHPDVFLKNSVENTNVEFEEKFKLSSFEKNPSNYGSKLIKMTNLRVVQIFETEYWGKECVRCILQGSNSSVYMVHMYGVAQDIFEGTRVTLVALPLDFFTYPNTMNQSIWAMACAGVSMTK